ncbi:acyl-[ACP]--phospholipid O-acyltransferase [Magnetococcales bacterium HHB-1]
MQNSPWTLFRTRRFMPLFMTQFLGATNDNVYKNALLVLIAYQLSQDESGLLVNLAAGLFILPFFLFSAFAGTLSDSMDKGLLMRRIKLAEVFIMLLGGLSFYYGRIELAFLALFLMGTQSAFFGPAKYAILPDHLRREELISGNALVEGGTFLAILIGTIVGGLLVLGDAGAKNIMITVLMLAIFGWLSSLSIPAARPQAKVKRTFNFLSDLKAILKHAAAKRSRLLTILGISWFWLLGAVFLTQMPIFAKETLFSNSHIFTLFLSLFSIGIAIGSLLCNHLLKGEISARYVPLGALTISLFIIDLYFASTDFPQGAALWSLGAFLSLFNGWRILFDLLGIAIAGGIYLVPLYAMLQSDGSAANRSRHIAANNIINALFMVIAAVWGALALQLGWSIPELFLSLGVANLLVAFYIAGLLPRDTIRPLFATLLKLLWKVEIRGEENLKKLGSRAVIVSNHVSLLDGIILGTFLPDNIVFAIDTRMTKKWWSRPFVMLVDHFPLDPNNAMAIKGLTAKVKEGKWCVIFPEGRLTSTGALMKIYDGPGIIADRGEAEVLPIYIEGAVFSKFSRVGHLFKRRLFPKITVTLLEPVSLRPPDEMRGRKRRHWLERALFDLMSDTAFQAYEQPSSLFHALWQAQVRFGADQKIIEDIQRTPLTYQRLVIASLVLGEAIAKRCDGQNPVGVLLPTSQGGAVTFFALQAYGRLPAMLNFSTGEHNMRSAIKTAEIKQILTSRKFIEAANLEDTIEALAKVAEIIYLEDLKKSITLKDRLLGLLRVKQCAQSVLEYAPTDPKEPAVILFTSGSEGAPKGVMLSHENLLSNYAQIRAIIDFTPKDLLFNALPMFHSFGLTAGTLLPVFGGIPVFFYPSPLHYRLIPEMIYDLQATILLATDTFLTGYARMAHAYDFQSIRYLIAGAEKVKESTRKVWSDKYGIRIYEGYGATEASPVVSLNTAMNSQIGSVGRLMPQIKYRLDPIPGIDHGGRLWISGPNIMMGYLFEDQPGQLQPPENGWHDTGDVATVDENGFLILLGRVKRFAKVGGEMVSLTAVEGQAGRVWPDAMHAAVNVPDPSRGEKVILITTARKATRTQLLQDASKMGIAEIMVPKQVLVVDKMPVLGTGKIDYHAATDLVLKPADT